MIPTLVCNGVDHRRRFPELAVAVATLPGRTLVLDGEVAIFDRQLRSRFEWLREPEPQRRRDADRAHAGQRARAATGARVDSWSGIGLSAAA
jgi:ATP-dependent DNA ligase